MKRIPVFTVDAFCDEPFGGNPAGVVPRAVGLSAAEMQRIAAELRHSETAFVLPAQEPDSADVRVRFFTPTQEVDLCGHATIATFHLMAERGWLPSVGPRTRVRAETGAGTITVEVQWAGRDLADRAIRRVMMEQPRPRFLFELDEAQRAELAGALGVEPGVLGFVRARDGRRPLPLGVVTTGLPDLLVPVESLVALRGLRPDASALASLCRAWGVATVHAFTLETRERRNAAACRSFSPALGIPEEAATGTASGALGAYLVRHGVVPVPEPGARNIVDLVRGGEAPAADGQAVSLRLEQGDDMGRPSRIDVEVTVSDGEITGVRVGGRAVTVLEGNLLLE
ncbi:MAG: PhzF family phenazine biosynthesis protein [Clostridia bacterium]|nr:PhzF family phenazine biosynthesis protein [Clostridia bacterium]